MGKGNRKYKDSVFTDVFYSDKMGKKNAMSLFNALHGTNVTDESQIEKARIENALYMNFRNDACILVNGDVLDLYEHQSTPNPNMPVRFLMYVAREIEILYDVETRYRSTLVEMPDINFFVFYNGKRDLPQEFTLRYSDAVKKKKKEYDIEVIVHVININTDKHHEILGKCSVLREYSMFIDTVRKYGENSEGMKKAIDECIERGILAEYLKRKGSEVRNMLIAEYDYETDMRVKQEEAMMVGREVGLGEGIVIGRDESKTRMSVLGNLLMESGRMDELKRVFEDAEFRDRLLDELVPEN